MIRGRRRLLLFLIPLLLFLLASSPAFAASDSVSFMGKSLEYDQVYHYDVSGDGFEELTFYMRGDSLVLSLWDTDKNGMPDLWFSYNDGDTLAFEGLDTTGSGEPDLFYAIDAGGEATLIAPDASTPILPWAIGIGLALAALVAFLVFGRKKRTRALSLLLAFTLVFTGITPAFGEPIIDEDCDIDEAVFQRDWLKYSDVDTRIELTSRSYEAQMVQLVADELRFQIAALCQVEMELEMERLRREELKLIKDLLVRNIKANLLKSFMRLSYITYDIVKNVYGVKGSVEKILDASASTVQIMTSYIKIMKVLKPSKTESQVKTIQERASGLINSSVLEYFDSLGDPKEMAKNLIKDLQKEAFDIVKEKDGWQDPELSEEDFQILRDQYLRNRNFDVAIQESYLISSRLREARDGHRETIRYLEAEYVKWVDEEMARTRHMLVTSCEKAKEEGEEDEEEQTVDPAPGPDPGPGLPQSGVPTAAQVAGTYLVESTITLVFDQQRQTASTITLGRVDARGERELVFSDFSEGSDLITSYDPETGYFNVTRTVEGITYTFKGQAWIQDGTVIITQTLEGGGQGSSFLFEATARRVTDGPVDTGIPALQDLAGVYFMNSDITETREGKKERHTENVEVAVAIVNGQVAMTHTAGYYSGSILDYDSSTGILSFKGKEPDRELKIRGSAYFLKGFLQMTLHAEQISEDYTMTGTYTLQKK